MNKHLRKTKTFLALGIFFPAAVGLLASDLVQPAGVQARRPPGREEIKEIRGYKNWTKVNPKPLKLPTPLDALCRMPTGRDLPETSQNPHRQQKYFTVYVNETGRAAMLTEKTPQFPEGSVIVKTKLLTEDDRSAPELLTVMVKQKKGFSPATGDWEYMVVSGDGVKVEGRGNLENCRSCHALNKTTDYVFRSYLTEKAKSELK